MYHIINTFSNVKVSSHKTLETAEKAAAKFQRQVKAANGSSSYIPYFICETEEKLPRSLSEGDVANLRELQVEV